MRRYSVFVFVVAAALAASACGSDDEATVESTPTSDPAGCSAVLPAPTGDSPLATISTNKGDIVVELDTANAPKGAGRFIDLAESEFYDGLTFHRVVSDFVIQGGDPQGDGSGGSDTEPVVAETPTDGYPIGSLAAAKTAVDPAGTFDAQFFIVTGPNGTTLPPDYARFGTVVSCLDVAKSIEELAPASPEGGQPTEPVRIESVTVTGT